MTTALVIDDNREMADAICQILTLFDIESFPVYGPRAAMMALQRITPDIIFMDINMPGVDGFEVLAYLRRYPKLLQTPVVIVTSDDQPETAEKAKKTGALLLIVKPVTTESLENALRSAGIIHIGD